MAVILITALSLLPRINVSYFSALGTSLPASAVSPLPNQMILKAF